MSNCTWQTYKVKYDTFFAGYLFQKHEKDESQTTIDVAKGGPFITTKPEEMIKGESTWTRQKSVS